MDKKQDPIMYLKVKGWKNIFHASRNQKKAVVVIFILQEIIRLEAKNGNETKMSSII